MSVSLAKCLSVGSCSLIEYECLMTIFQWERQKQIHNNFAKWITERLTRLRAWRWPQSLCPSVCPSHTRYEEHFSSSGRLKDRFALFPLSLCDNINPTTSDHRTLMSPISCSWLIDGLPPPLSTVIISWWEIVTSTVWNGRSWEREETTKENQSFFHSSHHL